MKREKNILICPLDWGLGHAGRMLPVIRKLQLLNHNIFIGSGEKIQSFYRTEITGVKYIEFPGFKIRYSRRLPQYIAVLLRTPLFIFHIFRDHNQLKRIAEEYQIDIVISDNRPGLWNKKMKTCYVTHQLLIPFPYPFGFLEFIGRFLTSVIIKRYSLCFIPDLPGELNLSGRLSHDLTLGDNIRYIGILSKYSGFQEQGKSREYNFFHAALLSGPEPQKEILKEKLVTILKSKKGSSVILEGNPDIDGRSHNSENPVLINHLPASEMKRLIESSETIITRPGYTTIMELVSLNKSALLVPTPGQTEQEYLGEYLSEKGWFRMVVQKKLDHNTQIPVLTAHWPDNLITESKKLFDTAINELLIE